MLLTGFDAPIEQVMYIDKRLREHNLLQAIARVNRVTQGKQRGFIVDYIGLANHLTDALTIYAAGRATGTADGLEEHYVRAADAGGALSPPIAALHGTGRQADQGFRDRHVANLEAMTPPWCTKPSKR